MPYSKRIIWGKSAFNYRDFEPGPHRGAISLEIIHGVKEGREKTVESRTIEFTMGSRAHIHPTDEVILVGTTDWGSGFSYLTAIARIPKGEDDFMWMTVDDLHMDVPNLPSVTALREARQLRDPIWIQGIPGNGIPHALNLVIEKIRAYGDMVLEVSAQTTAQDATGYLRVNILATHVRYPQHRAVLTIPYPKPPIRLEQLKNATR